MEIFDKLFRESQDPTQSQRTLSQWKDDETHLFQYGLFAYMVKNNKFVENFTDEDWEQLSEIVPTKDSKKCYKRWLFIQKLGGNKSKWSKKDDEILRCLVQKYGPRDWSNISEKFNEVQQEMSLVSSEQTCNQRNGKQCRERWLTALDPSINKKHWSLKEDIEFLEKWLQLGNKWREIANQIDGRTESQVKNRFKLILRRDHIQQSTVDPEKLRNFYIPRILQDLRQRYSKGEGNLNVGKSSKDDEGSDNSSQN